MVLGRIVVDVEVVEKEVEVVVVVSSTVVDVAGVVVVVDVLVDEVVVVVVAGLFMTASTLPFSPYKQ